MTHLLTNSVHDGSKGNLTVSLDLRHEGLTQVEVITVLQPDLPPLGVLENLLVLCPAVKLYPDEVVSVWAWGHALASILYVLGYYLAFKMVITANKIH